MLDAESTETNKSYAHSHGAPTMSPTTTNLHSFKLSLAPGQARSGPDRCMLISPTPVVATEHTEQPHLAGGRTTLQAA